MASSVNIEGESDVENMQMQQNDKTSVDQPHIKRPVNPYILWGRNRSQEISSHNPKLKWSDIHKQLGAEWKLLTDEQKQPFIDESKRLREQLKRNHPEYNYQSDKQRSFYLWSQDRRDEIFNPKLHYSEINKQLSAEWKLLTIEEKRPYIDEAKRLREQRVRDNPDYNCILGRNPKCFVSTQCAETQSQEDSPFQNKCTYLEPKPSQQELNPSEFSQSYTSKSSLIQHSCCETQHLNEESPLDLSVRKFRQQPFRDETKRPRDQHI